MIVPLLLSLPLLALILAIFLALWPETNEHGVRGICGLIAMTLFVSVPPVAFALDTALA